MMVGLLSVFSFSQAQERPADFLAPEFHKNRREALRARMPENSVAVFFANPIRNRANDVDYIYHPDPDLFYFTGYREPHAVLLIFKEKQTDRTGNAYDEIFFVQERNAKSEMWTGRRLGDQGVKDKLQILNAYNGAEFSKYNPDFGKFDKVLFHDFMNDVRDTRSRHDLYDLIQQFKEKTGYAKENSLSAEVEQSNLDTTTLTQLMKNLRGIKTPEELDMLRKAIFISAVGQVEVMKAMRPGLSEAEIQGIHEFVFKNMAQSTRATPPLWGMATMAASCTTLTTTSPT